MKVQTGQVFWVIFCLLMVSIPNSAWSSLTNVALQSNGATATADSSGPFYISWGDGPAEKAIDGSHGPSGSPLDSWCGQNVPGWLMIEFGTTYEIEGITIWWHQYANYTYSVSLSTNATEWTTVVPTRESTWDAAVFPPFSSGGDLPISNHFTIAATSAKYLKIDVSDIYDPLGHGRILLSEVEAYAVPEPATLMLLSIGVAMLRRSR